MGRPVSLKASVPTLRQIVARFWPQIRKQRLLIVGSVVAMFMEVSCKLLEPWPLAFVLDWIIYSSPAEGPSGIARLDSLSPMALLTLLALALVLIASFRAILSYLRRVGFALVGNRVLTEARGELFSHLQRLSLSFHNKSKTGDLITRVTGDIGRLQEVAATAALPMIVHALTLVGMLGVMALIDWRLSLVAVGVLPLFAIALRRLGGRIRKAARRQRQREGQMGATAAESIGAMKVVQALSLEAVHEKTFVAHNRSSLKEGVRTKRLSARLMGTADILIAVGTAVVLWFGARLVLQGAITPGHLIVFLAYLKTAFKPMHDLAKYAGRIAKASASAERILEVLDTTPLIRNRPHAVGAPQTITSICFEKVSFGYEPHRLALDDFSLEAKLGQVIALAGPSGAGKSTVANLLLRLYDPVAGRITCNGKDIRDFTIESLRRSIAVVPQDNVLFGVSAGDNIGYGLPGASDAQIVAAAKLARAHEFILALPQGYDTILGERGETLSEGQRQRISLARAAIREAPILVLDEPTASLDNENNRLVCEAMRKLSHERISFIIAHDLSTVEEADLILFLYEGRIVEQGTHAQLMQRAGHYAAMYALQSDQIGQQNLPNPHVVTS